MHDGLRCLLMCKKGRMRILHVITSLQTGGAETLVVNLIPRFQALGYEVGVVVFNAKNTSLMRRLESGCPGCRIYKLGGSYYNPWYIVRLAKIMRQYDVVHTHNTSPQLFAAIASQMRCSAALVTTEHNSSNRRRNWKWYPRWIDRWMYNQYQRVICISQQAEENLRAFIGKSKAEIITIYNGVDVKSFHSADANPSLRNGSRRFVAVMVAGFRDQKDQDTLIKCMTQLNPEEYELWLVGDGDRRECLESLTDSLGLRDRVMFWGMRTDIPEILHTADVIVMSSHYEGLSLSNIEGMCVGKPFVASDVDGLREMTEGAGILFPHQDYQRLAEIITELHDNKTLYEKTAQACYNRAKQFDISKMVQAYSDVYRSLI